MIVIYIYPIRIMLHQPCNKMGLYMLIIRSLFACSCTPFCLFEIFTARPIYKLETIIWNTSISCNALCNHMTIIRIKMKPSKVMNVIGATINQLMLVSVNLSANHMPGYIAMYKCFEQTNGGYIHVLIIGVSLVCEFRYMKRTVLFTYGNILCLAAAPP